MNWSFLRIAIIIGLACISIITVLYSTGLIDNCSIKHANVVNELKKYHKNLDPVLCEDLNDKIIELNNKCGIEIDVVDCG